MSDWGFSFWVGGEVCDVREVASGLGQEFPVRWLLVMFEIAQMMSCDRTYWIFESFEAIVW